MSGSNNQAFNAIIPRDCGNTAWTYYGSNNSWLFDPDKAGDGSSGIYSAYAISMPFAVSKVKISLISYPSYSSFGYLNRDDRSGFTQVESSKSYYSQGSTFDISVNSTVVLMEGTTIYMWSQYKYILKLFPGYLMFGFDVTRNTSSGSLARFVLRDIDLNIIAYR